MHRFKYKINKYTIMDVLGCDDHTAQRRMAIIRTKAPVRTISATHTNGNYITIAVIEPTDTLKIAEEMFANTTSTKINKNHWRELKLVAETLLARESSSVVLRDQEQTETPAA